jgi:hypothetical protein
MFEVHKITKWMKNSLAEQIALSAFSTPSIRRLMDGSPLRLSDGHIKMLHCLESYRTPERALQSPIVISANLEIIDMLVRTYPECRSWSLVVFFHSSQTCPS